MSETALELLRRYRDTYLKNHEQEKIYINAVLEPKAEFAEKLAEAPAEAPKEKKRGKAKH